MTAPRTQSCRPSRVAGKRSQGVVEIEQASTRARKVDFSGSTFERLISTPLQDAPVPNRAERGGQATGKEKEIWDSRDPKLKLGFDSLASAVSSGSDSSHPPGKNIDPSRVSSVVALERCRLAWLAPGHDACHRLTAPVVTSPLQISRRRQRIGAFNHRCRQ